MTRCMECIMLSKLITSLTHHLTKTNVGSATFKVFLQIWSFFSIKTYWWRVFFWHYRHNYVLYHCDFFLYSMFVFQSHINRKTQYENPVLEARRQKILEQQQPPQPPEGERYIRGSFPAHFFLSSCLSASCLSCSSGVCQEFGQNLLFLIVLFLLLFLTCSLQIMLQLKKDKVFQILLLVVLPKLSWPKSWCCL